MIIDQTNTFRKAVKEFHRSDINEVNEVKVMRKYLRG